MYMSEFSVFSGEEGKRDTITGLSSSLLHRALKGSFKSSLKLWSPGEVCLGYAVPENVSVPFQRHSLTPSRSVTYLTLSRFGGKFWLIHT